MADHAWKAGERRVCAWFNTERTGPTGLDDCDCDRNGSYPFGVELKHGSEAPINQKLQGHMEQAIENAHDLLPVLVLHPKNWPWDESWVCMPAREFRQIIDLVQEHGYDVPDS